MRILSGPAAEPDTTRSENTIGGFNLHAFVPIQADDRRGLERLLRYMGRRPISEQRLSEASDGRIIVKLLVALRNVRNKQRVLCPVDLD